METVAPIENPVLLGRLESLLTTCLEDNRQAWILQTDGTYVQRVPKDGEVERGTHAILLGDPWGR